MDDQYFPRWRDLTIMANMNRAILPWTGEEAMTLVTATNVSEWHALIRDVMRARITQGVI